MQPWPLLGIAQLIVAMNDTLPQLGTAVRMQLPGYGWVVEGSVARLEASHAVHELDSKRTSRHTRKAILSCIAHQQNIGQQQILQFKPQLLQRKEPRKCRHGRQPAFVLRGVWRRPSMKVREAVAILQRTWLQGVRRRPNMKALEFCLFVCLFEFFLVFVF